MRYPPEHKGQVGETPARTQAEHEGHRSKHGAADVVVIGGGLAGLSAACLLADAGAAVTLIERRSVLGGRASSYRIPGIAAPVDNCQHVLTRSCTALLGFYERLGVAESVRFDGQITFIDRQGRASALTASALPSPLHLGPSFARLPFLGARDKLGIAGALAAMRAGDDGRQDEPFSAWLERHEQTRLAVDAFWRPVVASALNEEPERASASCALFLFRASFLGGRRAWELGVPTRPLVDLHDAPATTYLDARGARIHRRVAAAEILVSGDAVVGLRLADGTVVQAGSYVAAVPYPVLPKLLPAPLREQAPFSLPRALEPSPIVAVHLWLDRPATPLPHAALIGRPVHWVFNKGRDFGQEGPTHLCALTSAARGLMGVPRNDLVELVISELREALPEARDATVLRALVVKEKYATFAPVPGCDRHRPGAGTPLRNLFLAGDWTATGWPATMESAVRSGEAAARAAAAG